MSIAFATPSSLLSFALSSSFGNIAYSSLLNSIIMLCNIIHELIISPAVFGSYLRIRSREIQRNLFLSSPMHRSTIWRAFMWRWLNNLSASVCAFGTGVISQGSKAYPLSPSSHDSSMIPLSKSCLRFKLTDELFQIKLSCVDPPNRALALKILRSESHI